MSFKVGIYDNLIISKATKNERGSLVITAKVAKDIDPIAALNASGSAQLTQEENDFLIYPIKTINQQGQRFTIEEINNEIANVKDPLDHILQQFYMADKIAWDIFNGTGISSDNYEAKLADQATLDKIYSNIVDQFIEMLTPHLSDTSKKLRGIFPRQSKAKHYPALRKKYLDSNPIFEPMTVPKEASKLRWSKFELQNGFNSGDSVKAAPTASADDAEKAKALFAK